MFSNILGKRSPDVKQAAQSLLKAQSPAKTTGNDERRRLPRELPAPEVVELDSDSAWAEFQALTPGPGPGA